MSISLPSRSVPSRSTTSASMPSASLTSAPRVPPFQALDEIETILCLGYLDATVQEVFDRMLGWTCTPAKPGDKAEAAGRQESRQRFQVTIQVFGNLEGSCSLFYSQPAAHAIASAFEDDDAEVTALAASDAVGEIGNMIVGSLRSKLGFSLAPSTMSVPTVCMVADTGEEPPVEVTREMRRSYAFGLHGLQVRLALCRAAVPPEPRAWTSFPGRLAPAV